MGDEFEAEDADFSLSEMDLLWVKIANNNLPG